mgnify:CR=1 FL=1
MICPQCGIANFYIKNEKGERINVKVTRELEIVAKDSSQSLERFKIDIIYCLGCSWKGKVTELKKYII